MSNKKWQGGKVGDPGGCGEPKAGRKEALGRTSFVWGWVIYRNQAKAAGRPMVMRFS